MRLPDPNNTRAPGPPRRVAVFRALQLGDLLVAVPALRAFRAAWPDAEVVLVGLPWAREFARRFARYVDGFREFPGYPGLPERPVRAEDVPPFLAAMQAERFDLAVQLHGSGRLTNPVVALFGAARCAGFFEPGGFRPGPALFCPWPGRGLEVHRLLALATHLGLPWRGDHLEFPLTDVDRAELAAALGPDGPLRPGSYAVVHPGASVPERRWPVGRFAAAAAALASHGLTVVLTGTAGEAPLTAEIARAVPGCVDLAGRTTLGAAGALLEGARVLVCNDTGVSHVAAGLGVPSVVVSTGDNPARWAPADAARHRVLCRASGVPAAEVVAEAEGLLRTFPFAGRGTGTTNAEPEDAPRCAAFAS